MGNLLKDRHNVERPRTIALEVRVIDLAESFPPISSTDMQAAGSLNQHFGGRVKVFLGGNYHFLYDCLGHQGSSASSGLIEHGET